MGFTHSWYKKPKLTKEEYEKILLDAKKLIEVAKEKGIAIGDYSGRGGRPRLNACMIAFNGVGDNSRDSFVFARMNTDDTDDFKDEQGRIFDYCKTAMEPYDTIVMAMLLIIKYHLKDGMVIRSDGDTKWWERGVELVKKTFDYDVENPIHSEAIVTWQNWQNILQTYCFEKLKVAYKNGIYEFQYKGSKIISFTKEQAEEDAYLSKLIQHVNHPLTVVQYGSACKTLECMYCSEIIIDDDTVKAIEMEEAN